MLAPHKGRGHFFNPGFVSFLIFLLRPFFSFFAVALFFFPLQSFFFTFLVSPLHSLSISSSLLSLSSVDELVLLSGW